MRAGSAYSGMRLGWLSDIHTNFLTRSELEKFVVTLVKTECDGYLITGDIAEAPTLLPHLSILDKSLDRPIYFVLGNHDFYRSSVATVREQVSKLVTESRHLVYLTAGDTVYLTKSTALVGHDGWADGRLGNFHDSPILMNDFELIGDFHSATTTRTDWLATMWRLAEETVTQFQQTIPAALTQAEHVIVATHVPPFRESSVFGGRISSDDFLPFFASRVIGDYLRDVMEHHPNKRMTVFCGHSHGRHTVSILDNLVVETAGAEYGAPEIQKLITVD